MQIEKFADYSKAYNENMELKLFENLQKQIIGYKFGKNLDISGLEVIEETVSFNFSWAVSTNANIRKIVIKPHANFLFYDRDNVLTPANVCEISIYNTHKILKTIVINPLTHESYIK